MNIAELKNKKVIFVTYSVKKHGVRMNEGPAEHLLRFFSKRSGEFVLLEQPYFLYTNDLSPTAEVYQEGKSVNAYKFPGFFGSFFASSEERKKRGGTSLRNKARDFFSTFYFFGRERKKYDLYIGMESINALCGIILRRLGLVKKVAYYLFDFTPRRYKNNFFNFLYIWLDRYCCYHCDYIWNISEGYEVARTTELKYRPDKMAPQITVHYGVDQADAVPVDKFIENQLIFTGSIGKENGVMLLVEMMPLVLKKIPNAKLVITGGGPEAQVLKNEIISAGLEKSISFLGFIADRAKVDELQKKSVLALAPYPDLADSTKKYGDVMKIREYFARGLPVVTTSVPPISKVVASAPAGIVTDFDKERIAEAVVKLLTNKEFYLICRDNALNLAKHNTWESNLTAAIDLMEF